MSCCDTGGWEELFCKYCPNRQRFRSDPSVRRMPELGLCPLVIICCCLSDAIIGPLGIKTRRLILKASRKLNILTTNKILILA